MGLDKETLRAQPKFDDNVYQFDPDEFYYINDIVELYDDVDWEQNRYNYTWPWDNISGYKSFGFDKTNDIFDP